MVPWLRVAATEMAQMDWSAPGCTLEEPTVAVAVRKWGSRWLPRPGPEWQRARAAIN